MLECRLIHDLDEIFLTKELNFIYEYTNILNHKHSITVYLFLEDIHFWVTVFWGLYFIVFILFYVSNMYTYITLCHEYIQYWHVIE